MLFYVKKKKVGYIVFQAHNTKAELQQNQFIFLCMSWIWTCLCCQMWT